MPAHQAPCPPVPRRPLGGEGSRAWLILLAGQTTVHSSGWKECLDAQRLLPSRPLTTALTIAHAHKRRLALEVFLADRHVLIDTKRLERTLRLIPPKENLDGPLDETRRSFAKFGYLKQGRRGLSVCLVALYPAHNPQQATAWCRGVTGKH